MRYAIYGLLVLFGIGGLALGANVFAAAQTALHEIEGLLLLLVGTTSLSAIAIVMAIEHAAKERK